MGSEDNFETFTYAVQELAKLNIGYIQKTSSAPHNRCKLMDLADFRAHYSGIIIGSAGYTSETAEAAISSGNADLIAFGQPFISNPDLVARFANSWTLADPDLSTAFTHDSLGYADYPVYQAQSATTSVEA